MDCGIQSFEKKDSAVEFQKSKNSEIIYVSACESVYRDIFLTDHETMRLSWKPEASGVSQGALSTVTYMHMYDSLYFHT